MIWLKPDFWSETMEARTDGTSFKILKGKKKVGIKFYMQQKYLSRMKAKHRDFPRKENKKNFTTSISVLKEIPVKVLQAGGKLYWRESINLKKKKE